jgi:nitrile hydratase beta subunit
VTYVSHADLGGKDCHERVIPEAEGDLFHAAWESRALALTLAMGATGSWNIDMSRAARETLPNYAELSYYEIWIHGLQKLLEQRGLVDAEEVAQSKLIHAPRNVPRVLHADDVAAALAAGSPTTRPVDTAARFTVGQRVRARSDLVSHHTRLPGYVRGKQGVIERVHGAHVFADANSQGLGESPQWLYTVLFEGRELWGSQDSVRQQQLSVDAWESYLEAV